MTTLKTQIQHIYDVEGFKIFVTDDCGDPAELTDHGVLKYNNKNMMPNKNTVLDWRCKRFSSTRLDYDCRILLGNGKHAKDTMTLEAVRASYV